jgi:hypothetical protein
VKIDALEQTLVKTPTIAFTKKRNYWQYSTFILATLLLFSGACIYYLLTTHWDQRISFEELPSQTQPESSENNIAQQETIPFDGLNVSLFGSYQKTGQSISYVCYDQNSLPEDVLITKLQKTLSLENRKIYKICSYQDKAILTTIVKNSEEWDSPYGLQLWFYKQGQNGWEFGEQVLAYPTEKLADFMLLDWTNTEDVVYALIEETNQIGHTYPLRVFHHNFSQSNLQKPQMIELCGYGITQENTKTNIYQCIEMKSQKSSNYLSDEELCDPHAKWNSCQGLFKSTNQD